MAKFKFIPLIALMCLSAGCGTTQPSTSTSTPSSPETPSTSSESKEEPTSTSSSEDKPGIDYGLSINMPEGRALKVAQFADIHFGVEGKDWHNDKVDRTTEYMDYVVETQKPDLIVCSGDNILSTGVNKLKQFIKMMEGYKTPWTFLYGNHDAEYIQPDNSKEALNAALITTETEYLLYDSEYYDSEANRWGNCSIQILNNTGDKLLGSIIVLDSGLHNGSHYEALTTGQIDWYKGKIDELQALYSAQTGNAHEIIPSIVFSHIQLQEHATLYTKALNKDGATFVIEQQGLAEADIKDGGPKENTGMYAAMVEKGSTKGYFVGHAHTYKYQVKSDTDGIVLGFGPQMGFSKCFEDNDLARTTYVYNLGEDFAFTTTPVVEDATKYGLLYSGTYEGKMTIDVETGLYSVKLEFALWNRILFSYQGKRLAIADFTGGITGSFKNTDQATWSQELYTSTGSNFIYSGSKKTTYIFAIDLTNMSLDVSIWVDPNAPTKPVTEVEVTHVNTDGGADSVNVYTQTTYFKKFIEPNIDGWSYNGWRYFIVVDPQGKIAYAVVNPPNGYGGPMGTGYYCHPDYEDYLTNPCMEILDGYGPWTPESNLASKKYNIVVPEGWLGITSHGAGNAALAQAFSNGERDASSDAILNARSAYLDTLRVSYDATNGLIKASWVE